MLSFLFRCVSAVIIFKARMRCHFFPEHIAQQKLHTTNKQTHKAPLKHFTVSRVRYHKNLSLSWLCKFILTHLILQTHAVRLALPQCSPPSEKRNISLMWAPDPTPSLLLLDWTHFASSAFSQSPLRCIMEMSSVIFGVAKASSGIYTVAALCQHCRYSKWLHLKSRH